MNEPILQVASLAVRFGGVFALDDVSMIVGAGTIHGLIGPNGAGKTTLFNAITGLAPAGHGVIEFAGAAIERLPSWSRARLGLARTFQNIRLFAEMTALETVMTGMGRLLHQSALGVLTRSSAFRGSERDAVARAREILAFVGLAEAGDRRSGELSYGDQRRLEIARALASEPRLLLLDEPAAGMNPSEKQALAELVRRIGARGGAVLLVEHDMPFVMSLCERITVLNFGRVISEGAPDEVRRDPRVVEAYLGVGAAIVGRAT